MEYNFASIEKKWQQTWQNNNAYKVSNNSSKPKYYVLDMFPYPSGAGLHVGHPLGYIASDIVSRYKRLQGFNVLHPMGYDAFGLPAEQYAIDNGIHPAISTEQNIKNFRNQLDKIGFCYDWSREVRTSEPAYYKWTQWIFLQLFNSFFNRQTQKAAPIAELITTFETEGNLNFPFPNDKYKVPTTQKTSFTALEWQAMEIATQQAILMEYRLAYVGFGEVNWCEAMGTVLANDEVINGVSERGGHPVVRKKLRQWYLRITEYADRLLDGLHHVEFSDAMKEMQSNWIGRSFGANLVFPIKDCTDKLEVYTTRPDTIFGVDFMVVAPEHELMNTLKDLGNAAPEVDAYIAYVKSRSERERQAEKKITGCFTGAFAINPFNGQEIPIYTSEYVLAGYGTGAIMAVPCGDERDFKFAKHFNIPITNIIGDAFNGNEANPTKEAKLSNSGFLDGMIMRDALSVAIQKIESLGIGSRKVNYKQRDAAFSRQRYWGEPFPIVWQSGYPVALDSTQLPLELPVVESYSAGPEGEGPLANIPEWVDKALETNTMPGFAGSSWYFLRYMDPHNTNEFASRAATDYWNQVDLYIGGTEHAVGHLLYSRFWTKVLFDLGYIGFEEPFKKLLNQGMIQGSSRFVYRISGTQTFVSKALLAQDDTYLQQLTDKIHVDVNLVDGLILDRDGFKLWRNGEYQNADFMLENDQYICGVEVEKMSKSKFNTVNPDDLVEKYGADTFRMYEMFLGPVDISKPWDTKGIEGVHRFVKKLWRLFFNEEKGAVWNDLEPNAAELKVLHKTIKKITEDTERFSFNTAVSTFMIAVNELNDLKCAKKSILTPLLVMLTPYAPHVCEELYQVLGHTSSILDATFPVFQEKYIAESEKEYPVSINGKVRTTMVFSLDMPQDALQQQVLASETVQKWMEGKTLKKFVFVPGKMINIVF